MSQSFTRNAPADFAVGETVHVVYTGYQTTGIVTEINPMGYYGPERSSIKVREVIGPEGQIHDEIYPEYKAAAEFCYKPGQGRPLCPLQSVAMMLMQPAA